MASETIYLVELGTLVDGQETKVDKENFEFYSNCYDHKHGYVDESQEYRELSDKEAILNEIADYVKHGVPMTYAVISNTLLQDEVLQDSRANGDGIRDICVEGETYKAEDIVWSIYKDKQGELHMNFVENQPIRDDFPKTADDLEKIVAERAEKEAGEER